MTPERRKYIDGISYEERVIRNQIDYHRSSLKLRKWLISGKRDEDDISLWKSEIAGEKIVIKALKKRLPQKMVYDDESKHWGWDCPACRYRILNDLGFELDISWGNCPHCGQKLG